MTIQQYTALAASLLLFRNESFGQVIYTDVPDTTIGNTDGEFSVDLNNDGIAEVTIKSERTDTSSTSTFGSYFYHDIDLKLKAIPKIGNRIVGGNFSADALESNVIIDINSPWCANIEADMAGWHYSLKAQIGGAFYSSSSNYSGPWYYNVGDRYLGLRFKSGSEVYYGWVRLLIEDNNLKVTLKDYAYQATADSGIYSGQNYPVQIALVSDEVSVHSSPGQIIEIHLNSLCFLGGKVSVTNLLGQSVAIFTADNLTTKHSLNNVPLGWYNVTVYNDGKQFNKFLALY